MSVSAGNDKLTGFLVDLVPHLIFFIAYVVCVVFGILQVMLPADCWACMD